MQPYIIIIKPYLLPDKRIYGAFVPDIPGCTVTGKTVEQTLELVRTSLRTALLGMVEAGVKIPPPTEFAQWEGRVLKVLLSCIGAVYVQFNDRIVHDFRFRETYRTTIQTLDMRPKIQILPFNALRTFFADTMP